MYERMVGQVPQTMSLSKTEVSGDLDLKEYEDSFRHAKKCALKPFTGEYYILRNRFYKKLAVSNLFLLQTSMKR